MSPSNRRANIALVLTLIVAAATGLRLANIQIQFVTGSDDAFAALTAIPHSFAEPDKTEFTQSFLLDGHPVNAGRPISPATNLLIGISYAAWGVGDWQARLPAIACGVLSVVLLFGLVRRLTGPVEGLFAAGAFALLPVAVLGSKYVGGLPVAWLALLAACLFHQRFEKDRYWIDALRAAFLAGVAALAAVQAIPFLPILALWAIIRSRGRAGVITAYLLALAGVALFYYAMPEQVQWKALMASVRPALPPAADWQRILGDNLLGAITWVGLGLALIGVAGLVAAPRKGKGLIALTGFLLVGGVGGLLIFSTDVEGNPLALGILAPVGALLCGRGLSVLWRLPVPYFPRLVCVLAVIVLAAGAHQAVEDRDLHVTDNKPALSFKDWIDREDGTSLAVRIGDKRRLLNPTATAAFYARLPLTDGDFATETAPERGEEATFLLTAPGGANAAPPNTYSRISLLDRHFTGRRRLYFLWVGPKPN